MSDVPILQTPIRATLFFSRVADTKREVTATPIEIAEMARNTTAREKDRLPWIKLAVFGPIKTDKGSLRHDANLLAITGIEADYDGGAMPMKDAAECLRKQGVAAVFYTSPSHSLAKPRWRVLCPLSREMMPDARTPLLGRLNGLLGGILSPESFTLSQSYYYGSVRSNRAHRVELVDGTPIDWHDDLDVLWIGKLAKARGGKSEDAGDDADEDAKLVRRIVRGDGYHVEMCALAARYLARGMTRQAAQDVLCGLMLASDEASRDDRWRNRFASISDLVESAEIKFVGDSREGRRCVSQLIYAMTRRRVPSAEMREAAMKEAERHNLPPKVAEDIAAWVARRERARKGAVHA